MSNSLSRYLASLFFFTISLYYHAHACMLADHLFFQRQAETRDFLFSIQSGIK
ncbi:MAG: hypothetical protein Q7T62_02605 [Undibacterium sp.]|nr:hypothetical protein [Undibacterium sp.]